MKSTTKLGLPLPGLGRLSLADSLERGFQKIDAFDAATFKLHAAISGLGSTSTTVQDALASLQGQITAIDGRVTTLEAP